jgi:hypothetical protein
LGGNAARRRTTAPGPSFVREEPVRLRGPGGVERTDVRVGSNPPATTDDGWWLALLWAADPDGVLPALEIAPSGGPPPGAPIERLGPAMAGALMGLVAQEGGRQALRVRMLGEPATDHPWDRPLVLQVALKWDAMRAATMTQNQLAREAARAFAQAIESAARPG